MKPTLKIIKNNMVTIFVIIVFIACMFVLAYFKSLYWDNNDKANYGDRTEENFNHPFDEDEIVEIKNNIEKDESVLSTKLTLQGRTIQLIVNVKDDLSVKDAKSKGTEFLKFFTEDELSYYAIQIYFAKEDKTQNNFPIIGYKHYNDEKLSWTKDREVTKDESK